MSCSLRALVFSLTYPSHNFLYIFCCLCICFSCMWAVFSIKKKKISPFLIFILLSSSSFIHICKCIIKFPRSKKTLNTNGINYINNNNLDVTTFQAHLLWGPLPFAKCLWYCIWAGCYCLSSILTPSLCLRSPSLCEYCENKDPVSHSSDMEKSPSLWARVARVQTCDPISIRHPCWRLWIWTD